ncbi:DUF1120 domain-containing protein [Candidatus Curculioniphilus buchneri]|uniref:DUF1120 domain-containing protein n=1 Tax=Candidatus Curculioniphilus buchneri TaxID=690594 RepID=UPI00376EC6E8
MNFKLVKKIVLTLIIINIIPNITLAHNVDVKVIGTITPSSCKITLTNGGIVDYGVISPTSLNKDTLTQLPDKQLDFAITCDAPTRVAIRAMNGRPNTAAGSTEIGSYGTIAPEGINRENGHYVVGLGLDGNKKIGGYSLSIKNLMVDGNSIEFIEKKDSESFWIKKEDGNTSLFKKYPFLMSWTKNSSINPMAFTVLSGTFNIQAYINQISEFNLTKPINLDGLTILELIYL